MKRIIIHHSDLDGYTAGAIARLTYPECDTLSLGYDKPAAIPEAEALAEYDQVIVVDYALPPATMKALNDRGRLLWIDHHFSSIRRAAEKMPRVDAIGGSSAGVFVDNSPRLASLFRGKQ